MSPVFQRLVRPLLDGLSLLVFLFAVTCAVRHMLGPACRGYTCLDTARDELQHSAALLEQQAHLDLDGLQASLAHGDSVTDLRVPGRRGRLEPLDPWQRPLILRPLDGDWLLELRSRGQDGRLDTDDDLYFRMTRAGQAVFDPETAQHMP
ncbi:hypothetical protein [Nannocystis punicea]|uniref:Uncharacterized protein n=1 Tax=Nannocystis punicea TaxID=2995304 RepID=A0ABY7GTR2_9BACT|nr:hypothetical protein [Nannocystis poenicansa]WAS90333.1 hypothetical protein O0S08_29440 [Nannocystis poenicansa]